MAEPEQEVKWFFGIILTIIVIIAGMFGGNDPPDAEA